MEINWFILLLFFIGPLVIIIILLKQTIKDEKKIEKKLDYPKKTEKRELND